MDKYYIHDLCQIDIYLYWKSEPNRERDVGYLVLVWSVSSFLRWPLGSCAYSTWCVLCCFWVTGTAACSGWYPCCRTSHPIAGLPLMNFRYQQQQRQQHFVNPFSILLPQPPVFLYTSNTSFYYRSTPFLLLFFCHLGEIICVYIFQIHIFCIFHIIIGQCFSMLCCLVVF